MTDTKDNTPLDYEAIHGRACALRNTSPGFEEDGETPHVSFLTQDFNTGETFESDEHQCPPPHGREYAGCVVSVSGCEMLTVATNEGEQMPDVAEAIASIGADVFALLDDRKRFSAVMRWLCGDTVGTSSQTMATAIMGIENRSLSGASIPHDPSDFHRCMVLLEECPWMRERLHVVAEKHPRWIGLVGHWGELEALWHKEAPTGRCPKLFARIQELTS